MKTYKVTWEIEVDAHSHYDAAKETLKIQRDSCSIATVFNVHIINEPLDISKEIDLEEKYNKTDKEITIEYLENLENRYTDYENNPDFQSKGYDWSTVPKIREVILILNFDNLIKKE